MAKLDPRAGSWRQGCGVKKFQLDYGARAFLQGILPFWEFFPIFGIEIEELRCCRAGPFTLGLEILQKKENPFPIEDVREVFFQLELRFL